MTKASTREANSQFNRHVQQEKSVQIVLVPRAAKRQRHKHITRHEQNNPLAFLIGGLAGLAAAADSKTGSSQKPAQVKGKVTAREALEIATDAYVFGYPLVTMDMTRRVMTNVRRPQGMRAPMGQFARLRTYPTASNHESPPPTPTPSTPSSGWTLAKEPWVVSLPDAHNRYCLFPMLDGWTTVFQAPGKRTTGSGPQKYAISGPGWKGKLPSGREGIQVPHQHRLGARPHLLHRDQRRLRRRACHPGPMLRRPAEFIRETTRRDARPGGFRH